MSATDDFGQAYRPCDQEDGTYGYRCVRPANHSGWHTAEPRDEVIAQWMTDDDGAA